MASEMVAGYIVRNKRKLTLSRSMRWVKHRKGNLARAWVHKVKTILEGGPWTEDAYEIRAAQWNPETTDTETTGQWTSFQYFLQDKGVAAEISVNRL